MNQLLMYSNLAIFICTAVSFTYGAIRFFKKRKALYLQMIVGGLGCMMLSRAFQFITILTRGSFPSGFHIGMLGMAGGFLFFLSANYGQMDKLLDDGARENKKYRLFALIAPCVLAGIYSLLFLIPAAADNRVIYGIMTFDDYTKAMKLILTAYKELREELSLEVFGKPLANLSAAEIQVIYSAIPMVVSEIEHKDIRR